MKPYFVFLHVVCAILIFAVVFLVSKNSEFKEQEQLVFDRFGSEMRHVCEEMKIDMQIENGTDVLAAFFEISTKLSRDY